MRKVTIVGASVAGVSAAQALRDQGFTGEVELIDSDPAQPYDRPPLSKQLLKGEWEEQQLLLRPGSWFDDHQITLDLGRRVASLDTGQRQLHFADGSTSSFEGLVIATGSVARSLPVPVEQPDRIHRLRTVGDTQRLRPELVAGRSMVIVGAGFIGLEAAAVARSAGMHVTVVDAAEAPMQRVVGSAVGHWFEDLHRRNGVEVRCGIQLEAVRREAGQDIVQLSGGECLAADVVLAAVGASPACEWLEGSGLSLDDGVLCEPDLSTSVEGIVAAGDAARWHHPLFGQSMRVEHWTNAVEQANHAVATLMGQSAPYRAVPYFWSDQFDAKARFVGLAAGHTDVVVDEPRPGSYLALFGAGGLLRGALCVNLPRRLAQYRQAINDSMTWTEAVESLPHRPARTPHQIA